MIKELGQLDGVRFLSDGIDPADTSAPAEALRALLARTDARGDTRITVRFRFGWAPRRIEGDPRAERVVVEDRAGAEHVIDADAVVTAIGFDGPAQLLPAGAEQDDGRLGDGLYCVGWARRGPRGTIPDARTDARLVAKTLAADLRARPTPPTGRPQPHRCLEHLNTTDHAGWLAIDRHERASAAMGRIRNKVTQLDVLLDLAHHHVTSFEGETA
jgi:ferredoxin--NADP+ reductase